MPSSYHTGDELRDELSDRFGRGMPGLSGQILPKAVDAAYSIYEKAPSTDLTVLVVYGTAYACGYAELFCGGWDGYAEMDPRLAKIGGLEGTWNKLSKSKGGARLASMAFAATSEILCDIPDEEFGNDFQLDCAKFSVTGYMNGYLSAAKDKKAGFSLDDVNRDRRPGVIDYGRTHMFSEQTLPLFSNLQGEMDAALSKWVSQDIAPASGAVKQYAHMPGDNPGEAARSYAIGLGDGVADALSVIEGGELPEDSGRYDAARLFDDDGDGNLSCRRLYSLDEVDEDGLVSQEFIGGAFPAAQLVDAKFCRMGMPLVGRLMAIDALKRFAEPLEGHLAQDMSGMDIHEQGELALLNARLNTCFRQMGYGYAAGWRLVFDREEAVDE